jgi:hypothetical protein
MAELVPIPGFLSIAPAQGPEGPTTFVGAIRFDQGKKLTLVGDRAGQLVTANINLHEQPEVGIAAEATKRLITLDTFPNVRTRQVDTEAIDFRRSRSIRRTPSLSMHFGVNNPESGEREQIAVPDSEIIDVFTGRHGGVVVFSGRGLPEETGLLFEHRDESGQAENRQALVLFMHPEQERDAYQLDSVAGLELFANQLTTVFSADQDLPLQAETLEALRKSIDTQALTFSEGARQQLLTLHLLSVARLIDQGETGYSSRDIKRLVPHFRQGPLRATGRVLGMHPDYQERVDGQLDKIIVSYQKPSKAEKKEQKRLAKKEYIESVTERLQTDRARTLWQNTTQGDYEEINGATRYYLNTVVQMIEQSQTPAEFADIQTLLDGLFSTRFGELEIQFILDFTKQKKLRIFTWRDEEHDYEYEVPALNLKTRLADAARKNEAKLARQEDTTTTSEAETTQEETS